MRWVMLLALPALAGLSVLSGCTQIQTYDSLADLLTGRRGPNVTPHITPNQELSVDPTETSDAKLVTPTFNLPAYKVEATDVLTIRAVMKGLRADTADPISKLPISGQFPVQSDGTVDLGAWGSVSVVGMNLDEVSAALRQHLVRSPLIASVAENLVAEVDVHTRTGRHYFLITENVKQTKRVYVYPLSGWECVMDAFTCADGMCEFAEKSSIRVVRKRDDGTEETLRVDWAAIRKDQASKANYHLQSGDRIYLTAK